MEQIQCSKMSGKLEGIGSLNTNPLTNNFCLSMSSSDHFICRKCYSVRMLSSYRKTCVNRFETNSRILSTNILREEAIPKIKERYFRFHSHGELYNITHLINFIKIVNLHPQTTFALYTKRIDLIKTYFDDNEKPINLIIVFSEPIVNFLNPILPPHFDKTFLVYTDDFVKENNVDINCSKKCLSCLLCYNKDNNIVYIKENIK